MRARKPLLPCYRGNDLQAARDFVADCRAKGVAYEDPIDVGKKHPLYRRNVTAKAAAWLYHLARLTPANEGEAAR